MPIYEYACRSCGHEFEELQKVGAEPPPCPECAADEVGRKVSRTSFVLKGGGWYKDLYSGPSNRKEPATKEASTKSTSTDSGSSSSTTSSTTSSSSD